MPNNQLICLAAYFADKILSIYFFEYLKCIFTLLCLCFTNGLKPLSFIELVLKRLGAWLLKDSLMNMYNVCGVGIGLSKTFCFILNSEIRKLKLDKGASMLRLANVRSENIT